MMCYVVVLSPLPLWISISLLSHLLEKGVLMDEVNHSDRTIYRHSISSLATAADNRSRGGGAGASIDSILRAPSDELIAKKLTQPTFVTFLDTAKIEFTKSVPSPATFLWICENSVGFRPSVCEVDSLVIIHFLLGETGPADHLLRMFMSDTTVIVFLNEIDTPWGNV